MRTLARRVARLEAASRAAEELLVSPEALEKMAAVHDAECARLREKLLGDGPFVPAPRQPGVESEVRARLREKLLRDDTSPATAPARM